eukprot:CAMPEP_0206055068 /NCGR_PEP_ID=MMETSP1466-20131121/39344_1 /ASSEMBLY_ACC=CAM_ASM_001126 /TAXON_ID=44452 /ORGANISM="Pavlova gyrans, Strain CCMP608" /LENGTH=57 /DNA_ID=CAMNT_0053430289 /DNA_START=38 /DNA_END=207 /DNA_ORIENTATION=-
MAEIEQMQRMPLKQRQTLTAGEADRPRYVLHPDGGVRRTWDVATGMVVSLGIFLVPV